MSGPVIRPLEIADISRGFLESLDALSQTSGMESGRALDVINCINSNPDHTILVAELEGEVVGAITLLVESKFIHDGGMVCHIEDVAVRRGFQGARIGERLVTAAVELGRKRGCYKTVLECSDEVRSFYEKCGFYRHAHAMRLDY